MHNDIEKVKEMVNDKVIKTWVAKHIKKKMYKINAIFKKMYPTGLGFTYVGINELTNKAININTRLQRTTYHGKCIWNTIQKY